MSRDWQQLRFVEIQPSDQDVRFVLRAMDVIEAAGPSMERDYLDAVGAAVSRYRCQDFTVDHWVAVSGTADLLVRMFGMGRDRAELLGKEHVFGSRRRAVIETTKQYLELVETEAKERQRRERRNNPPVRIGRLPPQETPILIRGAVDVPNALALAKSRKAAR